MNSKQERINQILAIAAGKPHVVRKARPGMNFTLVDRSKQIFRNDLSGEELTWRQIQERYIGDVSKFWGFCGIADSADDDDLYFDSIDLFPVHKTEIIPVVKPLKFYEDITINLEDYVKGDQNSPHSQPGSQEAF